MSQRMDVLCAAHQDVCGSDPMSELDAFIAIDPTLAGLNKEYLEARDYRRELVRINGCDDPMAEVAADMEDSSWCAMQTRYLMLRERRELMEQAQRLMRQSEEKIELEIEEKKKKRIDDILQWTRSLEFMRKNNKADPILEWALVIMMFSPKHYFMPTLRTQFAA